jgi:hypothetical protein
MRRLAFLATGRLKINCLMVCSRHFVMLATVKFSLITSFIVALIAYLDSTNLRFQFQRSVGQAMPKQEFEVSKCIM